MTFNDWERKMGHGEARDIGDSYGVCGNREVHGCRWNILPGGYTGIKKMTTSCVLCGWCLATMP